MSNRGHDKTVSGTILVVLGIIFLLNNLDITDIRIWDDVIFKFWPLVLIYIGAKNLISYLKSKK